MSRKTTRRIDNKRVRAAEKQALNGGHTRVIRSNSSTFGEPVSETVNDEVRYPKKKEHRPPKRNHCPVRPGNKACEWIEDTREVPDYHYDWESHIMVEDGTKTEHFKMCGWCGAEKIVHNRMEDKQEDRRKWRKLRRLWKKGT